MAKQLAAIKDDQLVLLPEAKAYLRKIGKGVQVIALFGVARTAKSTTANMLLGTDVFGVSNMTDPCTFGVWIHAKPLEDGKTLLLVDSEGMGLGDTSQHHKIMALLALLTCDGGVLINNEMKNFTSSNLENLGFFIAMRQMLNGLDSGSWPALFILLRDFSLQLTVGRRPATPSVYLNHLLEDIEDRFDEVRRMIRKCFPNRSLFVLPPPSDPEKGNLHNLPSGTFRDNFSSLKSQVMTSMYSKTIGNRDCDGAMLVDFLDTCVQAINKRNNVDVPSSLHMVMETTCKRIVNELAQKYDAEISPLTQKIVDEAELSSKHTEALEKATKEFDDATSGLAPELITQYQTELEQRLASQHNHYVTQIKLAAENRKTAELVEKVKKLELEKEQSVAAEKQKPDDHQHIVVPGNQFNTGRPNTVSLHLTPEIEALFPSKALPFQFNGNGNGQAANGSDKHMETMLDNQKQMQKELKKIKERLKDDTHHAPAPTMPTYIPIPVPAVQQPPVNITFTTPNGQGSSVQYPPYSQPQPQPQAPTYTLPQNNMYAPPANNVYPPHNNIPPPYNNNNVYAPNNNNTPFNNNPYALNGSNGYAPANGYVPPHNGYPSGPYPH